METLGNGFEIYDFQIPSPTHLMFREFFYLYFYVYFLIRIVFIPESVERFCS